MKYIFQQVKILYLGVLFLIICTSFLFYAPCNYAHYNSDHAIHVLMTKDFQLPRDFYYWGQNRLGSLIPMISFLLGKLINIHPLFLCSIVQYLFLSTGFLILSSQINNYALKIALCALIFLPVNEYNALILIGHPYSSQLFAGSLFVFSLALLRKYLLNNNILGIKNFLISILLSFLACTFFVVGVWVSEFNAIFILIPAVYILFEKKLRNYILTHYAKFQTIALGVLTLLFFLIGSYFLKQAKMSAITVADSMYNKAFINNIEDLTKNLGFFLHKLTTSLFFKDAFIFENLFNWFIILLTIAIIVIQIATKKRDESKKSILTNTLVAISFVSSVILFCSTWLLKNDFSTRYFTPIYVVFCFALLLILDRIRYRKLNIFFVSLPILFFSLRYCYGAVISKKIPGPFEMYADYKKLPKGVLIGDYWDAYKINSIAIDNLQSIPFETQTIRNWDWREVPLRENNIYFLNNGNTPSGGLRETIFQFGYLLKHSGIRFTCNSTEVLLYNKVYPGPLNKIVIKSSNNKYLSIDPENCLLIANQTDSSKAEIFQVITTRIGMALKASNNKFVCADLSQNGSLIAKSNIASTWEIFQFISSDKNSLHILSLTGKFVCADQSNNNIVVANRNSAQEWETFKIEIK